MKYGPIERIVAESITKYWKSYAKLPFALLMRYAMWQALAAELKVTTFKENPQNTIFRYKDVICVVCDYIPADYLMLDKEIYNQYTNSPDAASFFKILESAEILRPSGDYDKRTGEPIQPPLRADCGCVIGAKSNRRPRKPRARFNNDPHIPSRETTLYKYESYALKFQN